MKLTVTKQGGIKSVLRNKIFTLMFGLLFISLITFNFSFKYDSNSRFQSRLISLANTAAVSISAEQHNTLTTQQDENTAVYRQIRYILQNIKKANEDVIYVYTLRKTQEKNSWEFVVDADKEPYHIGDPYDVAGQESIEKASLQPVADTEISTGRHGKFFSGFAPIKDEAGRTVGLVGVDISADAIIEQQKQVARYVNFGLILTTIILALYGSHLTARNLLAPVSKLVEAVRKIKEGDYNQRIELETNDEFQQMAESINDLASTMQNNRQTVEVDLKSATEWKDKIFKVYGDVITSMTKGKFNLVSPNDVLSFSREGLLYNEIPLNKPEDADKAGQVVEKLLAEKSFKSDDIKHYVVCVTEAATNVVKHAGHGLMQLRILDSRLRVIFSDEGSGMDLEMLPNILFFQENISAHEADTGLAYIYKYAGKLFLSTSEKGTILAMDFE